MRHSHLLFFIATISSQRPTMSLAAAGRVSSTTSSSTSWPQMERPNNDADDGHQSSSSAVPAIMNYVSAETTEMSTRRDLGGGDSTLVGVIWEPKHVDVHNARLSATEMSLDKNGFELQRSGEDVVGKCQEIDFCSQDDVVDSYYPICEQLVENSLKGSTSIPITCVCAFDHNVRSNDHSSVGEIKASQIMTNEVGTAVPQVQNPAGIVHADYTSISGPRRLGDLSNAPKLNDVLRPKLLSQKRSSLLDPSIVQEALDGKRRYAFINVWRSIDQDNPVKDHHLACIDSQTVDKSELRTFKIHYADRVGENYFACPSSPSNEKQHSWCYYPDMTMEEALFIKQWDSRGNIADGGSERSTFAIHSAFLDPTAPKNAPPRKSIEVRCIVIWDKE
eukprot:scaffold2239_cov114-Skeletonema_dohrnii-CCMP3373.AAC.16